MTDLKALGLSVLWLAFSILGISQTPIGPSRVRIVQWTAILWCVFSLAGQLLTPGRQCQLSCTNGLTVSKGLRRARSVVWLAIFCGWSDRVTLSITDLCFSLTDVYSRSAKASCPTMSTTTDNDGQRGGVLRRAWGVAKSCGDLLNKTPDKL